MTSAQQVTLDPSSRSDQVSTARAGKVDRVHTSEPDRSARADMPERDATIGGTVVGKASSAQEGRREDPKEAVLTTMPRSPQDSSSVQTLAAHHRSGHLASPCNISCRAAGHATTCGERVLWASQHKFAGQPRACSRAHKFVLELCEACSACQLGATGCRESSLEGKHGGSRLEIAAGRSDGDGDRVANTLEGMMHTDIDSPPRSAVVDGPPRAFGRSGDIDSPAKSGAVDEPPKAGLLAFLAKSDKCSKTCSLGGQSATCSDHLLWAAKHVIEDSAEDACGRAHVMVRERCSICSDCTPAVAGCQNQPPPAGSRSAERVEERTGDSAASRCAASCVVDGRSATCAERVLNVSKHRYVHVSHACPRAHRLVSEQCLVCAHCPISAVCGESSREEATLAQPATDVGGGALPHTGGSSHGASYDCRRGQEHHDKWPLEKQTWCCRHKNVACDESLPLQFDCDAGFANWQRAWSTTKQTWCCKRRGRGCRQYSCNLGQNSSQEERAWCCKNRQRGCPHVEVYTRKFDETEQGATHEAGAASARGPSSPPPSGRPVWTLVLLASMGGTGFVASLFAARSMRGDAARLYKRPKVSAGSAYQELRGQDGTHLEMSTEVPECME